MLQFELVGEPLKPLEQFYDRLTKPSAGEWRKVGDAATQGFAESFSREGNASGKWRPLAPATVLMRQARGYAGAHPILVQSGATRDSWTQRSAADHVEEFHTTGNGWELRVGTRSEIATFHESGTSRMPARSVLPITAQAEERLLGVLDFLAGQIQAQTVGR